MQKILLFILLTFNIMAAPNNSIFLTHDERVVEALQTISNNSKNKEFIKEAKDLNLSKTKLQLGFQYNRTYINHLYSSYPESRKELSEVFDNPSNKRNEPVFDTITEEAKTKSKLINIAIQNDNDKLFKEAMSFHYPLYSNYKERFKNDFENKDFFFNQKKKCEEDNFSKEKCFNLILNQNIHDYKKKILSLYGLDTPYLNNLYNKYPSLKEDLRVSFNPNFLDNMKKDINYIIDNPECWVKGNLGKILTIIGLFLTFIVYMMHPKWWVLFMGIVASLTGGGTIGIANTFFEAAKPIIYIYPTKQMDINVSLDINGDITKSIPDYNNGWKVNIKPSGRIDNKYDSLFYENTLKKIEVPNEGWIVEKSKLNKWFEEKLTDWNFSKKEKDEFIEYWIPRLNKETDTKYIDIRLFTNQFLKENMKLIISPTPDKVYRYEFVFKGVNRNTMLSSPIVPKINRIGYFAVEWGGGFDID